MGHVIKFPGKSKPEAVCKAPNKLASVKHKKPMRSLADYYGVGPTIYEDGLTYQKKQRE
jgi:hypothetical protein